MELGIGAASGVVASEVTAFAHNDPSRRDHVSVLEEMNCTLHELHNFLKNTSANTTSLHEIVNMYTTQAVPMGYKKYQAIFILVPIPCTFTVSVSGLQSFVWTPNVGIYNRWKYPEGTTIQLITPSVTLFPLDVLYTDDTSN